MPSVLQVGRGLRRHAVTARLLTEWRVGRLLRSGSQPELIHSLRAIRPGSLVVDVGASVGNYALAFAKANGPDGMVLALEANPAVYRELVNSTWRSRVLPINAAASDRPGLAEMFVPYDTAGKGQAPLGTLSERTQPGARFPVPLVTVDALTGDDDDISLIKIDVEGHEMPVVAGARATIQRCRPTLVIEIEERHSSTGVRATVEAIMALGYRCYAITSEGLMPWSDFDVHTQQIQRLDMAGGPGAGYVNNFLFVPWPAGVRHSATTLMA